MGLAPTGHEMATIRRDTQQLLRFEVQVWRPGAGTSDGHGSRTYTPTLASSGPGELAPMTSGDQEFFAEKIGLSKGWWITVKHDRDVRPDDQLRVNGRRFEVVSTDRGRSGAWLQRVPTREISV